MSRLSAIVVSLALLPISSMLCAQDFTPVENDDMIKSGYAGCLRTQMKLPANEGAPLELIQKYCACTAKRTAARITRAEVDAYQANNKLASAAMIAKAQQIGIECRAELAR
jgi:hypothetical protein